MKVERITPVEPIQPTHNDRRPLVPDTEDGGKKKKKKKKEEPTIPIEDIVTLSGQDQREDE